MAEFDGGIIVGVLGQWASGKTTAANTLINHLGGEGEVEFITDRVLFAGHVVDHILSLEDSKVVVSIDDDGRKRIAGELAIVWLRPGEDLRTVDVSTLDFDIYDNHVMDAWRHRAKIELGYQIREKSAHGIPIVIEAAFGPNIEPAGENSYGRTINDLFLRLEETGVKPSQIKWIIVETGYAKRSERNGKRQDSIPARYFESLAADGGDLEPEQQKRLEEQGTKITKVSNNHDEIGKFRADVIAAFEEMFGDLSSSRTVGGERESR